MMEAHDERDPEVAALLREHYGDPASGGPDWDGLHQRVMARARPELVVLRRRSNPVVTVVPLPGDAAAAPRRSPASRRAAVVVPVLLAACVALLLMTGTPGAHRSAEEGVAGPLTVRSVDEILDADISDDELRAVLLGGSDAVALLLLAAGEPEEG